MLGRITSILTTFQGPERTLGISEIARRTGIPKASTSRIVSALVDERMLERAEGGVCLGIRLFELGEHASRPSDLRKLTLPHMADLRTGTGKTVHLAVLEGYDVVYIQILRSRSTPPLPSRVGGRLPAHATGVGKVLLAHLPVDELEAHVRPELEKVGPRTITDRDQLLRQLKQIRDSGISYEREESAVGVGCAASAILGSDGRPLAALSASMHLANGNLNTLGAAVATSASAATREAARSLRYTRLVP